MRKVVKRWREFSEFLNKDTWISFVVTLILAFILIKFIFFPGLSFLAGFSWEEISSGRALPLVIVESCSMYHYEEGFDKIFSSSNVYENYDIEFNETSNWDFQNGLKKGDVVFVVRPKEINVGDVIIFYGGAAHPLIHRVVDADDPYATKGDNYRTNSQQLPSEKNISEEIVIGKALFRIPLVGWTKLIFFEGTRNPSERGLCK